MKTLRLFFVLGLLLVFGTQQTQAQWTAEKEINWFGDTRGDGSGGRHGGSSGSGQGGEIGGDNPSPDPPAPLGSGLLVLAGLSVGYACVKQSHRYICRVKNKAD